MKKTETEEERERSKEQENHSLTITISNLLQIFIPHTHTFFFVITKRFIYSTSVCNNNIETYKYITNTCLHTKHHTQTYNHTIKKKYNKILINCLFYKSKWKFL